MKDVPTPQLGSNRWLSNSDIKMLYKMYDCGKIFFTRAHVGGCGALSIILINFRYQQNANYHQS